MTLTSRQMRAAEWVKRFEYDTFRVYTTETAPGFALVHDRGHILYQIKGKGTTDSLSQAVKWWNDAEQRKQGRHVPAGSPAAIAAGKGAQL